MPDQIAILLLASGLSQRFGDGDKLLAILGRQSVLARAAQAVPPHHAGARFAVVGEDQDDRTRVLKALGYHVVPNPTPEAGQGNSLSIGIRHVRDHTDADAVLVLLGDMPFVTGTHVSALMQGLDAGATAVMSETDGVLLPPAAFRRQHFDDLGRITGDSGARKLFERLHATRTVIADRGVLLDIDRVEDLTFAEDILNG
ncbi:nucleotidyltransferase family protein [Hyphomonas johnsonii]|uniref:MobA-like protein n=1 Tax=Hyphomonas johnsonii MHS-2 TaxID=1280950 RepID=A0A059FRR7_9PROT|nr:nucleotidyltransferase family protein [Hyphomonas johnsonii]KCZ93365.1 MobA-like protein [Hyphomonas johnsonii MHS-2]